MNWSQIEPMIDDLQHRQVETMDKIVQLNASDPRMPKLPKSFNAAKQLVAGTDYNVVVCGEVKKGKSSLLNAIIGQEILPVNSEIATSQVFRISNSETESFELVFTDETRTPILREQLSRYGSQVDANLRGEPAFKGKSLAYIQINIPITFLPKGVSLVDTPGLGALYKSHEWITQNYVQNANAILFVLDPERPIEAQEKKFILRALEVTNEIIFVMTKIDLYTPETWNAILQRNEKHLAEIYAERGKEMPYIMPVSSVGLMKAANGKVQALKAVNLKNSKFPELKAQLVQMMYRGVGLLRTGQALNEAVNQTNAANAFINDMLKVCVADNQQEQQRINEYKSKQQERLQAEWGAESKHRQQAMDEVGAICSSVQSRVLQMLSTTGPIFKEYESKINRQCSMGMFERLGKDMASEVVNDVSSQWMSIARLAERRVAAVLSEMNAQMNNTRITTTNYAAQPLSTKRLNVTETLSCWRGAFFMGSIGASISSALGAFAIPGVGPLIGLGLLIAGWHIGLDQREATLVERNKQLFRQKLIELLNELSSQLLHIHGNNTRSIVGQFTYELEKNAKEAMQTMVENQKAMVKAEMEKIEQQARANIESRLKAAEQWNEQKKKWNVIASELKEQIALRKQIEEAMKE